MGRDGHLRMEDYIRHHSGCQLEATGNKPGESFACRVHRHLVETCSECRAGWSDIGAILQKAYRDNLAEATRASQLPPVSIDDLSAAPSQEEEVYAATRERRRLRRRAKKQLSKLRCATRSRREEMIRASERQFNTRKLAQLLIDEARATVRDDPAEAESMASLVPLVLDWTRGPDGPEWATALRARAEAHRANALRVGGDLPAADQAFVRLNQNLVDRPVADSATLGEIASLEASLRIGQRRFAPAEELLQRAALAFAYAGDADGLARARIQHANLMQTLDRPRMALLLLEDAAASLPAGSPPYLTVCTVTGRVNALCDLDRPSEAQELLAGHLDAFEFDEAAHTGALLRGLEGRVALGLGEFAAAEGYFAVCARVMHDLGRHFDAALAALFLAETFLKAGRVEKLDDLARRLAHQFASRGVLGEAQEALEILAQATLAREVTAALLAELRNRVTRVAAGLPASPG